MARRKKYPKLANGFGSIQYLGKGRRFPYAVRPPVKAFDQEGKPIREKPIAYVDDWMKGFAILTAYHAGTLTAETIIEARQTPVEADSGLLDAIAKDYAAINGKSVKSQNKTFSEVYEDFYAYKFGGAKKYSASLHYSMQSAFRNCASIHDRVFADLRHDDLQQVVDSCPLKHASVELIMSLFHQMYAYADIYGLVDKDHSAHVRINRPDDDIHGEPFTEEEIAKLWEDADNPTACMLLIMIYTGFRVGEFAGLTVTDDALIGGSKTAAGKNRTVPIHHRIVPLIEKRRKICPWFIPSAQIFRREMRKYLDANGMTPHTPHDTRHTFSMLCERYGVSEHDRKRMLGHKIADITAGTYGHRTLEDLRKEIEKLP